MSSEFRLKKLRGSGGYVMASVTDDQQKKGNLGGPDLFLAPVGRISSEKISKYFCNTCEKDFEGSPRIDFENPNELVADNLILLERGQYICSNCGSVLAEYRSFSKPNENADVGLAKPQTLASQILQETTPEQISMAHSYSNEEYQSTSVSSFNDIVGLIVYNSDAKKIGVVKQIGIQAGQQGIVLVVTKDDGNETMIRWEDIQKIGEIVLIGSSGSKTSNTCRNCNYDNKPDSKFCENCGNKL